MVVKGVTPATLALQPGDRLEVGADAERLVPRGTVPVAVHRLDGRTERLNARAAVETRLELAQLRDGGVMPAILKQSLRTHGVGAA